MNEIKFRFYHKDYGMSSSKTFKEIALNIDNRYLELDPNIMQYTGLKDKNGVEIYEGDILSFNNYCDKSDEIEYKGLARVIWNNMFYGFSLYGYKSIPYSSKWNIGKSSFTIYAARGEVIGNIYENPELLDKSNSND